MARINLSLLIQNVRKLCCDILHAQTPPSLLRFGEVQMACTAGNRGLLRKEMEGPWEARYFSRAWRPDVLFLVCFSTLHGMSPKKMPKYFFVCFFFASSKLSLLMVWILSQKPQQAECLLILASVFLILPKEGHSYPSAVFARHDVLCIASVWSIASTQRVMLPFWYNWHNT